LQLLAPLEKHFVDLQGFLALVLSQRLPFRLFKVLQ
jgi:hypothetical protein